jgi:hypothetical protein
MPCCHEEQEPTMKITIEIDDVELASKTVSPGAPETTQQPAESRSSGPGSSDLDQLYARAAAMGALDAGPAPDAERGGSARGGDVGGAGAQGGPQAYIGAGGTGASSNDQSGGAAPSFDTPAENH